MPDLNRLAQEARGSVTMGAAAGASGHPDPISLAVGEPAEAPPDEVLEAAQRAIAERRTRYGPSGGLLELRARLAEEHAVRTGAATGPEEVVVTAGGKAALIDALRCTLGAGDEVLLLAPFWPTYREQVRWCGAETIVVPAGSDGLPDVAGLEPACTARTRAVILNSPNNPTGSVLDRAQLGVVADLALRRDLWILSDEVYRDLAFEHPAPSLLRERPDLAERTVVVDSFSKRFAMTGFRVGSAVAPPALARALLSLAEAATTHPSTVSQHAAVAALDLDGTWEAGQRARYSARSMRMCAALDGLPGVECRAGEAGFYAWPDVTGWVRAAGLADAGALADRLREREGLLVTPGQAFAVEGRLRLSCGLNDDRLEEALSRLRAASDTSLRTDR